jgi:hypothetical protein
MNAVTALHAKVWLVRLVWYLDEPRQTAVSNLPNNVRAQFVRSRFGPCVSDALFCWVGVGHYAALSVFNSEARSAA